MRKIVKSCIIAFSVYSKIPVPQLRWTDEDMKYMMCFFPWIGAVVGGILYGWFWLAGRVQVGNIGYVFIGTVIPLLLTGGFHVDGFMDTMDALHSYQSKERKLEILKDSHIGAFACIMLVIYGLLYMGAFSEVKSAKTMGLVCSTFFLSRCLSGIGVVSFRSAKKEGMLYTFSDRSHKRIVKGMLYVQTIFCVGWILGIHRLFGGIAVLTAFISFGYYRWKSYKEFGGVTGDTAGYFVLICECSVMITMAILEKFVSM